MNENKNKILSLLELETVENGDVVNNCMCLNFSTRVSRVSLRTIFVIISIYLHMICFWFITYSMKVEFCFLCVYCVKINSSTKQIFLPQINMSAHSMSENTCWMLGSSSRSIELLIQQNDRKCSHMQKFFLLVHSRHRHWGNVQVRWVQPVERRRCAPGKDLCYSMMGRNPNVFYRFSSQTNLRHQQQRV